MKLTILNTNKTAFTINFRIAAIALTTNTIAFTINFTVAIIALHNHKTAFTINFTVATIAFIKKATTLAINFSTAIIGPIMAIKAIINKAKIPITTNTTKRIITIFMIIKQSSGKKEQNAAPSC